MSLAVQIGSQPPSAILIVCLIGSISIIVITPNLASSQQKSHSKLWPYSSNHWAQHYHPLVYSPSPSSSPSSDSRYKNGFSSGARRHQSAYYYPEPPTYSSSGKLSDASELNHQYSADDPDQIYGLSERYDYEDDDYKKHTKVEHHEQHEIKEMSFVYPVLLALLILGALFIPFISLFFFLAVSAFNCNGGLGSNGFGQVTPFMGKRRRRRRSVSLPLGLSSIDDETVSNGIRSQKNKTTTTGETRDDDNSIEEHLPRLVLFDAAAAADQQAADAAGRHSPISDYEFWRKQLARNTVRLRDALVEFGAWLDHQEEEDDGSAEH